MEKRKEKNLAPAQALTSTQPSPPCAIELTCPKLNLRSLQWQDSTLLVEHARLILEIANCILICTLPHFVHLVTWNVSTDLGRYYCTCGNKLTNLPLREQEQEQEQQRRLGVKCQKILAFPAPALNRREARE